MDKTRTKQFSEDLASLFPKGGTMYIPGAAHPTELIVWLSECVAQDLEDIRRGKPDKKD